MQIYLEKSLRVDKKFRATIIYDVDGETKHRIINFGDNGYLDYTIGASEEQQRAYVQRHKSKEDWDDPFTAGFWAYWFLWRSPSKRENLKAIELLLGVPVTAFQIRGV